MGGSISKYSNNNNSSSGKTIGQLTEKKSLAVQTDFEMDSDQNRLSAADHHCHHQTKIITVSDPRSPTTMFARTPIQVQVSKNDERDDQPIAKIMDNIANIRNKHLETAKSLTEFDSPLNIKMKFVQHATILNDKIERIRSRNLIPKSQRFAAPIDSQTNDRTKTRQLKPYLETNLDEDEEDGAAAKAAAECCAPEPIVVPDVTIVPVYDPVQNAIDKMTEKLNDFSMLKVKRAQKPRYSNDVAVSDQPITNYETPKRGLLTEKTRTPFSEIQSRIPVGAARKQNEIIKKKLNVNLVDENNENTVVAIDSKPSSNLTLLEPKAATWDTNKTILF